MDEITYKTEDHQAIFNFVVQKLFDQRGPSVVGATCYYRAEERKCAFGWLIPDSEYKSGMELHVLDEESGLLKSGSRVYEGLQVPLANAELIRSLQKAHDYAMHHRREWLTGRDIESFRPTDSDIDVSLRRVAHLYGLDYSLVNKLWPTEKNGSQS